MSFYRAARGSDITRRALIATAGAALILPGCRAGGSDDVLKVASQKGGTKALLVASGALEGLPYRIEWSEFPAAQHLLEAVGSGAVDVGLAGDAPFQFAYQSGSPIKAIAAQRASPRPQEALALVVRQNSAFQSIADLKGRLVATTRGSIGHYLVLRALAQAGLPASHVKFSWLAPGDAKAAFDSGAVDAWSIWVPYLATAVAQHARVLVDGQSLVRSYSFEVANETAIARKQPLLADFAEREARALDWMAGHKDQYAAMLAGETGLPLDIARITAEKNQRRSVPIDAQLIADQVIVLDTFTRSGDIATPRPIEGAFLDIRRATAKGA